MTTVSDDALMALILMHTLSEQKHFHTLHFYSGSMGVIHIFFACTYVLIKICFLHLHLIL